jgi:hypothetical protein
MSRQERVVPASLDPARLSVGVVLDQHERRRQPILLGQVADQDLGSNLLDGVRDGWTRVIRRLSQDDNWQGGPRRHPDSNGEISLAKLTNDPRAAASATTATKGARSTTWSWAPKGNSMQSEPNPPLPCRSPAAIPLLDNHAWSGYSEKPNPQYVLGRRAFEENFRKANVARHLFRRNSLGLAREIKSKECGVRIEDALSGRGYPPSPDD